MNTFNLIPDSPCQAPNYWCSWGLQNALAEMTQDNSFGLTGHSVQASVLTEENMRKYVFDADFLKPVRKDLYVLYDVGWDVEGHVNFDDSKWKVGSLIVATDKFPSCTGTPVERLTKLNKLTKEEGWRGAGLWIIAHAYMDGKDDKWFTSEENIQFYRERMGWCREAGINYWKVDYGAHCGSSRFRKMLTDLAKIEAPELVIEHARNGGPLNDIECPWDNESITDTGLFSEWQGGEVLKTSVERIKFSDVFRIYDLTYKMSVPTALDRTATLLREFSEKSQYDCILNCENEIYIAAVLGCTLGIMSCSIENQSKELSELSRGIRALRWQRIAPPWGVGQTETLVDTTYLEDTWDFRKNSDWATYLEGKHVKQLAPARVSRNMPLPEVVTIDAEAPYVICSRHPNGAVAVASLHRISIEKGVYYPRAHIAVNVSDIDKPVGVFGIYESLTFVFPEEFKGSFKLYAQDLMKDFAQDITDRIVTKVNSVTLSGDLINEICGTSYAAGDAAEAGLMLKFHRN